MSHIPQPFMASNDISPSLPPSPLRSPPPPLIEFNPYFPVNLLPPITNYTDTVPSNSGSSSSSYTRFFTVAVICLCLVSSLILFLHLYLRYVRRQHMQRHRRQTANLLRLSTFNLHSDSSRAGLDRDEISSIPSYQYQKEADNRQNSTGSIASADCAVCLSVLEEGDVVRMLPACRHVFHVACIDKWLTSRASCPVCRADVFAQTQTPGQAQSQSQSQSQSTDVDVTDVHVQEQSRTKEEAEAGTSVSTRLSSSFRRMLSSNRSSRRIQDDRVMEDLERGNGTNSNN